MLAILDKISIRNKLALIAGFLFLPTLIFGWLFVQQSFKDIHFADKERGGVSYLQVVWPNFHALILAANNGAATPLPSSGNTLSLNEARARFDALMDLNATAERSAASLAAIGWPDRPITDKAAANQAIANMRALIGKIADGSNLTLDPDLDSFYVMDTIAVRLPDAVQMLGKIEALIHDLRGKAQLSPDDRAEMVVELTQFKSLVGMVSASVESAMSSNADGRIKVALGSKLATFNEAASAAANAMQELIVQYRDDAKRAGADTAAFTAATGKVASTMNDLWAAGASELDRLLIARIWGFYLRLWEMLAIAGVITVLAALFAAVTARGISGPLNRLNVTLKELAEGNVDTDIPGLARGDEIGAMARGMAQFKLVAQEKAHREAAEKHTQELLIEERRKQEMAKLADLFETSVGEIVTRVLNAARQMRGAADSVSKTAANTEKLAANVASVSDQTRGNIESVASATEELSSSIMEISRQVQESSRIAGGAVEQVQKTNARITDLSQAAIRVGDVVKLINAIAEQTNLLALNATIEAARAGDAGRGFAVVAQEVKALATQTARATDDISGQISAMQSATSESVTSIEAITATINEVSQIATSIASAVEEQGAATQEISRNLQQVASGTSQVVSDISDVHQGANGTSDASVQMLSVASEMNEQGDKLQQELSSFMTRLRSA